MSEKEKLVMVTRCPDRDDVLPHYCFRTTEKELKKTLKEFCESRGVTKKEVRQHRVPCNVDGCFDASEVMLEYDVPGVTPDFFRTPKIF